MKLLLTLTTVAAILSHHFIVAADGSCPSGTAKSDVMPACPPGEQAEESPQAPKCWKCVSSSCPLHYMEEKGVCCPEGRKFPSQPQKCEKDQNVDVDPNGCWKCSSCDAPFHVSAGHCCPEGRNWSTSKEYPEVPGQCCFKGHSLAVSKDGKSSYCCQTDYTFEGGRCIPPDPVPPPGTLCPATKDNCIACEACKHNAVCPGTNGLGIEYGKCYLLEYSTGTVGRALSTNEYNVPGYYPDISFMVCDPSLNCDKKGPVGRGEQFTLWDVVGLPDWVDGVDPKGNPGFFSDVSGHQRIAVNPTEIAKFVGNPSCLDGQYGICIQVKNKGAAPVCPDVPTRFATTYRNSKACLRFVFKPITCA
ncbi:hypothetical protein BDR22DRAFT_827231 [Usnea florida]